MPAFDKYRKILSVLLPAGLIGASFLLSTTALAAVRPEVPDIGAVASEPPPVAERLAAIRDAVSSVVSTIPTPNEPTRLAWGNWGNGFFGIPLWNNWHNGWNNWSNWRNNWNNWRNNWNNWHNWHNWGNY
jgi:hypothetical protein